MTTDQFWLSVLTSFVASFIFLFVVLILFKPKLIISKHICRGKLANADPAVYYFIKIINWSLFGAYDVKVELLQNEKYTSERGQMNSRNTSLSLVVSEISHIPGYLPSWVRKNAPYAIRVRSTDNLESILDDDHKSVLIKISAKHGLTGLVKVKTREYTDSSQLKIGRFKYGLNFGVLN